MYLKRIELRGFKSFADKTIVEFKQGVTCIVGPNGSGKSNITDAIRWVLGEQRVKTLRGSKMEDVIFGGTKHRKPLGMAEVKLIFDNRESFFPLDYEEVEIVRRVFRSGDSEYSVNGMACRLKDIRELLMDTGIGREGYSIIGQGKIDEILSGGRDERRLLFEEAAGILKYKVRKVEASKKLANTHDNLSRIEDIIVEIEDRVEPLRLESERAMRYLDLSEQLRQIELYDFSRRYTTCENALVEVLNALQTQQDSKEVQEADYEQLKAEYESNDEQLFAINRDIRLLETQYHEKNNERSQTKGERSLIEEKIQNVETNVKRIHDEIADIDEQITQIDENVAVVDREVDTETEKINTAKEALIDDERALEQCLMQISRMKQNNETDLQTIYQKLNEIEVMKREAENLERANEDLSLKIAELNIQIEQHETAFQKNEQDAAETASKLKAMDTMLDEAQGKLSEAIKLDGHFVHEREKMYKQIDKLSKRLNESQTELKLLETLEAEYDGYDKGVKEILTSLPDQSGIHGIVASVINVPKTYETAVEVALGRSIQHIVCETDGDAKTAIEFLRKNQLGRVTFLPLNQLRGNGQQKEVIKEAKSHKGFIGVASELIDFPERYSELIDYLLGRIMIVEDFETARRLMRIKNIKYKIITLLGDVLIPGGTITGGSFKSKMTNILGRRRRIETLGLMIEEDTTKSTSLSNDLKQIEFSLAENKAFIQQQREAIDKMRLERVSIEHLSDQHKQMAALAEESAKKAVRNAAMLAEEMEDQKAQIRIKREAVVVNQAMVDALEVNVKDYKDNVESFESESRTINDQMTSKRIELASMEQQLAFKARERKRLCDDLETVSLKRKTRVEMLDSEIARKEDFYHRVEDIDALLKTLSDAIEAIVAKSESLQASKASLSEKLKTLTMALSEASRSLESIKSSAHQLDLKKVKLEVEKETIVSDLWERYELSIGEVLSTEPVTGNIKQLKNELKQIGSVNVNAIKEYETVSERYRFLKEQEDDLLKASQQLEKIIADLEKQMIEIFTEHFVEIGEKFKETFKMLFHGGDAAILLADESDILNSDIEIIAQPPGKKLQSLNLLSGGEKALTAIALLFAILKTKPTPFCILDEIEAALDDVNVYRFAEFIKDYADKSQFVVITHRKGTMEVADTLFGVTMEEYGISKVLSVRLEDVEDAYSA
ncbi:chromosome segregation protein SMC [Fusibacter paucivorans]|uniref:Chromosome partition protein Smc n=1 Tax=Fusibacter paucivorans TaxID=76009 RepID=A0ABS5PQR1_9FIRM|nr:chromosome segregation protein SMC [Fusibacter paucivorans]MBS7527465.1 chromosome segregation protein SMC [Fusibacter paucivorans]